MSRISYHKIPVGYAGRVDKLLTVQLGLSTAGSGRKKIYRGKNILVSINQNIATVLYDNSHFSDKDISNLFKRQPKGLDKHYEK